MGSFKWAAAAAALVAVPLAAQEAPQQTVEGAQEFLRLITTQFSMGSAAVIPTGNYYTHLNTRFEPESACVTSMSTEVQWRYGNELSRPELSNEENWAKYRNLMLSGMTIDASNQASWDNYFNSLRRSPQIDWSSVSSVETVSAKPYGAADEGKRVVVVHAQPAFALVAPDAPLATRIAYAMEFLRAACDRSAETGF